MARRTKIIATLGPATRNAAAVRALIEAGVDCFRLNFSHGTQEEQAQAIAMVGQATQEMGRPVALLQDPQGPKIRVGALRAGPIEIADGAEVTITTRSLVGDGKVIPVAYTPLPREVSPGDRILFGDGEIEACVLTAAGKDVRVRVTNGGLLKEKQGVNLSGVRMSAPALTEKDVADLKFGLQQGVDYIALSFVRGAEDLRRLRAAMDSEGSRLPVVAKLEKQEAIDNLDYILAVADGVMVARGDLGLELPPERVPLLQKEIIRRANERGKLVITATQMLESMVNSPRPTRAEASDVANAILDGTDAVMLSGETAIGRYPVQAVRMMARIAEEAEGALAAPAHAERARLTHAHAMSRAAVSLAQDVRAAAIVVFTRSGYSAHLVSKERPAVPIFAFTPEEGVYRQLALCWGVAPILMPLPHSAEEMIARADEHLVSRGLLQDRKSVV